MQQKNCLLTIYHPSFMVHWWLLVHSGLHRPVVVVVRVWFGVALLLA
jgi:hypothetical protein